MLDGRKLGFEAPNLAIDREHGAVAADDVLPDGPRLKDSDHAEMVSPNGRAEGAELGFPPLIPERPHRVVLARLAHRDDVPRPVCQGSAEKEDDQQSCAGRMAAGSGHGRRQPAERRPEGGGGGTGCPSARTELGGARPMSSPPLIVSE